MKKDVVQNLREKSESDLQKERQTKQDALWKLKTDLAAGKVKNVRQIHQLKKEIAVINTLIKEKANQ